MSEIRTRGARRRWLAPTAGLALVAVHAAAMPALVARCRRAPLSVSVHAPTHAPHLDVRGHLPDGVAARTQIALDGAPLDQRADAPVDPDRAGPGMHRVTWRVEYQGGFERQVGVTQLVGPFQDPADPPCALRLLVSQSLLDGSSGGGAVGGADGGAPGTLAQLVRDSLNRELAGLEQWPLGAFERVERLSMRWVRAGDLPGVGPLLPRLRYEAVVGPDDGLIELSCTLAFSRGQVPLRLAAVPSVTADAIELAVYVSAELSLDSRIYQWVADVFGGDDIATRTAQREVDVGLAAVFGRPPPLVIDGRRALSFRYCPGPIEAVTGAYAAIGLALERPDGAPIPAVALGPAPRVDAPLTAPLAVELELDAINGILHDLWRTGYFDDRFAEAGAVARFNDDPRVAGLLSVRIADLRLSMPPTATAVLSEIRTRPLAFELAAEAALSIRDGDAVTPATLFGTLGFAPAAAEPTSAAHVVQFHVALSDLALACQPAPGVLAPCYGDLVQALRDDADDVHGLLTTWFQRQLDRLILGQTLQVDVGAGGAPTFTVTGAALLTATAPPRGAIRVELFGDLVAR